MKVQSIQVELNKETSVKRHEVEINLTIVIFLLYVHSLLGILFLWLIAQITFYFIIEDL